MADENPGNAGKEGNDGGDKPAGEHINLRVVAQVREFALSFVAKSDSATGRRRSVIQDQEINSPQKIDGCILPEAVHCTDVIAVSVRWKTSAAGSIAAGCTEVFIFCLTDRVKYSIPEKLDLRQSSRISIAGARNC